MIRPRVYAKPHPSYILGRYGVGKAYRTVLRDQATWRDIRGIWINTAWFQVWLTVEDK